MSGWRRHVNDAKILSTRKGQRKRQNMLGLDSAQILVVVPAQFNGQLCASVWIRDSSCGIVDNDKGGRDSIHPPLPKLYFQKPRIFFFSLETERANKRTEKRVQLENLNDKSGWYGLWIKIHEPKGVPWTLARFQLFCMLRAVIFAHKKTISLLNYLNSKNLLQLFLSH